MSRRKFISCKGSCLCLSTQVHAKGAGGQVPEDENPDRIQALNRDLRFNSVVVRANALGRGIQKPSPRQRLHIRRWPTLHQPMNWVPHPSVVLSRKGGRAYRRGLDRENADV